MILLLLLVVDLDQPVLLHHAFLLAVDAAVLVEAPGLLPLARLLVELLRPHAALLARLGLDAPLRGELLPLRGGLDGGQRLLARQGGARVRQGEEDALGRRGDGAGAQELIFYGGGGRALVEVEAAEEETGERGAGGVASERTYQALRAVPCCSDELGLEGVDAEGGRLGCRRCGYGIGVIGEQEAQVEGVRCRPFDDHVELCLCRLPRCERHCDGDRYGGGVTMLDSYCDWGGWGRWRIPFGE